MDAMPGAGKRKEGGRGGTARRPAGPGYEGRPTRLRRSCPGLREERLGRGTLEPRGRDTWKMLKADERFIGLKSDHEGGEMVWTKGTGERHRWELGVQGLVCFQGRHLRVCLGCRGGRRGRTSREEAAGGR